MQLARQQRKVLLIVDGFFLAVQEPFDVIDTCIATAQKKLEKCDMRVKWMNQTTLTPFIITQIKQVSGSPDPMRARIWSAKSASL